ncbi:MAG: thermonuclease family protein [Deltaproteobacteria bacterium]|nr:thermonuclease family protein [Deltaproteobacteria bacterium]
MGCSSDGSKCGVTEATVARVIDGDTIELTTGERIRYLLVNAPETTSGKNECYGQNAVTFNTDLVANKQIHLEYDEAQCEDRFDRLLAYVSVDGQEVNALLVQRGYACVLHIPPAGDSREDEFKAYQAEAKAAGRGLWGQCDPIPCN